MSLRKVFRNFLIIFPFAGLLFIFSISTLTGCPILDRPLAFLGEDCQSYGIHWNNIVSPLGLLVMSWVVLGPAAWILFRIAETVHKYSRPDKEEDEP